MVIGKRSHALIRHLCITAITFVMVGFFAVVTLNISFLNPISQVMRDFSMSDIYYQALGKSTVADSSRLITIVDMTELYERRDIVQALDEVEACAPKVVGIDIVFEGLKEDVVGDMMIEDAASSYRSNTVFSYRLYDYDEALQEYTHEVHSFFTDSIAVNEGFTNMQRNLYGGIKRTLSFGRKSKGEVKPSFIAQVINHYADKDIVFATDDDVNINFSPVCFPVLHYDSIKTHPEWLADHIVLFGATHDEADMHYTPLGKMAGIELLAYAIHTTLQQKEVKQLSLWWLLPLSFFLVLLTQWVRDLYLNKIRRINNQLLSTFLSSSVIMSLLTFFWMVCLMGGAYLLFNYGININLGLTLSAIAFIGTARSFFDTCTKSFNSMRQ